MTWNHGLTERDSSHVISLGHHVRIFANAVTDAVEEPDETSARQGGRTAGLWQFTLNFHKVDKISVTIQLRMSHDAIQESTTIMHINTGSTHERFNKQ